jgi:hypothetical protein
MYVITLNPMTITMIQEVGFLDLEIRFMKLLTRASTAVMEIPMARSAIALSISLFCLLVSWKAGRS